MDFSLGGGVPETKPIEQAEEEFDFGLGMESQDPQPVQNN